MRKIKSALAILIMVLLMAGCNAKSPSYTSDAVLPETSPGIGEGSMDAGNANTPVIDVAEVVKNTMPVSERKLVTNGAFSLETLQFDKTLEAFEKMVTDCGGYIQSSSKSGQGAVKHDYVAAKWANYIARVPADKLGSFTENLDVIGSVVQSTLSVDDITDGYYDIEARIKSLQAQEQSLLDILAKAAKLEDVISLQTALSDVRYQLESNQGIMRRMDNQVSFSTLTVSVQEVYELNELRGVPSGMWGRIKEEFKDSLNNISRGIENIIVLCLGNILGIAFWGVIIFIAVKLSRKHLKKRQAAKDKTESHNEADDKKA